MEKIASVTIFLKFYFTNIFLKLAAGDIMEGSSIQTNVVVEGNFSNIERIILSANGNLQRIMSAYYNLPVSVKVVHSTMTNKINSVVYYDREVELIVRDRKFCTAVSKVILTYIEYIKL